MIRLLCKETSWDIFVVSSLFTCFFFVLDQKLTMIVPITMSKNACFHMGSVKSVFASFCIAQRISLASSCRSWAISHRGDSGSNMIPINVKMANRICRASGKRNV